MGIAIPEREELLFCLLGLAQLIEILINCSINNRKTIIDEQNETSDCLVHLLLFHLDIHEKLQSCISLFHLQSFQSVPICISFAKPGVEIIFRLV